MWMDWNFKQNSANALSRINSNRFQWHIKKYNDELNFLKHRHNPIERMGFQTAIEKSFIALLNWTLWFWEQNAKYAWIMTFLAPQNRISMAHNLIDEPINAIPSNINPLLARFELKIFFKSISLPHCVRIDLSSIHHGRQKQVWDKKIRSFFW